MENYKHLTPFNTKVRFVRWEDIVGADNWNDSEVVQPIECGTICFVLEDSPTMMVVASTYNFRDEEWATMHAFPKVMPTAEEVPKWDD